MRVFFKTLVLLSVIAVAGVALFVFFTDEDVIILNDGTIKIVDETWQSGDSVFFESEGQIDFYDNNQIRTYGKRNIKNTLLAIKLTFNTKWNQVEAGLSQFLKKNHVPVNVNLTIALIGMALLIFLLIRFHVKRTGKKTPPGPDEQADKVMSSEARDELPTGSTLCAFF